MHYSTATLAALLAGGAIVNAHHHHNHKGSYKKAKIEFHLKHCKGKDLQFLQDAVHYAREWNDAAMKIHDLKDNEAFTKNFKPGAEHDVKEITKHIHEVLTTDKGKKITIHCKDGGFLSLHRTIKKKCGDAHKNEKDKSRFVYVDKNSVYLCPGFYTLQNGFDKQDAKAKEFCHEKDVKVKPNKAWKASALIYGLARTEVVAGKKHVELKDDGHHKRHHDHKEKNDEHKKKKKDSDDDNDDSDDSDKPKPKDHNKPKKHEDKKHKKESDDGDDDDDDSDKPKSHHSKHHDDHKHKKHDDDDDDSSSKSRRDLAELRSRGLFSKHNKKDKEHAEHAKKTAVRIAHMELVAFRNSDFCKAHHDGHKHKDHKDHEEKKPKKHSDDDDDDNEGDDDEKKAKPHTHSGEHHKDKKHGKHAPPKHSEDDYDDDSSLKMFRRDYIPHMNAYYAAYMDADMGGYYYY